MPTLFNPERLAVLRSHAQRQIAANQFAGIAWQVDKGGLTVEQGCEGYADAQRLKPLQSDALYRLYSMTKPVVSVRCLQLIEAGLLQLDDPVSRWLPGFASMQVLRADGTLVPAYRGITVEDLLTHRAGLSYDFLPDCAVADQCRDAGLAEDGSRTLDELVAVLASLPLARQPGEAWYYSYATDVLAGLLQVLCDRPLGELLDQALFSPLGMQDTGFSVPESKRARLMSMFGQKGLGEVPDESRTDNALLTMDVDKSHPLSDARFERGGHGLYSTINDYRAFLGVLMHGRAPSGEPLLSAPMLELLWRNRLPVEQLPITIGTKPNPGYGWGLTGRVMQVPGQAMKLTVAGEGGWAGAASTWFWVDRSNGISGQVMTQYLGSAVPLGPDMQALAYSALLSAS